MTRSDFLADRKKLRTVDQIYCMGNEKYYLAPKCLIKKEELPDGWGLVILG